MSEEMQKGFTCECGEWHEFSSYVFAHWRELLIHTCPKCGAKHEVLVGHTTLVKED